MGIRKVLACFVILAFCAGCGAGMKESLRGVAGTSTKVLEDGLAKAESKEFSLDYDTSYAKTLTILKKIKAYIYREDRKKNLIAIYVSEEDTTPVGIFFKEIDKAKTRISVSSPSSSSKGFIAGLIFEGLEK